jgi:plasmid stabilization system protein ParE
VRARAYLDRIQRLCTSLADFPEWTVPRDDLLPGLRTVALDRRVLIALTVTEPDVTILRVLYAGRDLSAQDVLVERCSDRVALRPQPRERPPRPALLQPQGQAERRPDHQA